MRALDNLDIEVEDPQWQAVQLAALARRAVQATLTHLNIPADISEISLLGCDDARIAALNADFRAKAAPTNVLSWPAAERAAAVAGGIPDPPQPGPDGLIALGDIAISYDTCAAEAGAAGKNLPAHATHLIVHGVLHLLGYDHETQADAALMEGVEVKILGKLGYDDPYRDT